MSLLLGKNCYLNFEPSKMFSEVKKLIFGKDKKLAKNFWEIGENFETKKW
jgi:hypothetical protein